MSFNGTGTFNINSTGQPIVTGTIISSTMMNALTADLGTGLSTCITRDGQSTPTNNIPMGGFKLTGVGLATATGDALSYGRAATVTNLTATGTLAVTGVTTLATSLSGVAQLTSGVVAASNAFTQTLTMVGSTTVQAMKAFNIVEPETISAIAATGTINLYPSNPSILYYTTASSGNFVLNVAWSSGTSLNSVLADGECVTVVFKNTNTGTPHYCTSIQVDGTTSGVTTKWQAAAPTAGNANALDIYTVTVTRVSTGVFNVLASLTPFT